MEKDERTYELFPRPFTEEELARMKNELVFKVGEAKKLRGDKSLTMKELSTGINAAQKAAEDIQEKISKGYEMVEVEVFLMMDDPTPGMKRIVRADQPDQAVRTEPMTMMEIMKERQPNLPGIEEEPS